MPSTGTYPELDESNPNLNHCVTFINKMIFYGEQLLAQRPTPNLEDNPFSAVRDSLFNIFAVLFHI
jgi:hypothetical protein